MRAAPIIFCGFCFTENEKRKKQLPRIAIIVIKSNQIKSV